MILKLYFLLTPRSHGKKRENKKGGNSRREWQRLYKEVALDKLPSQKKKSMKRRRENEREEGEEEENNTNNSNAGKNNSNKINSKLNHLKKFNNQIYNQQQPPLPSPLNYPPNNASNINPTKSFYPPDPFLAYPQHPPFPVIPNATPTMPNPLPVPMTAAPVAPTVLQPYENLWMPKEEFLRMNNPVFTITNPLTNITTTTGGGFSYFPLELNDEDYLRHLFAVLAESLTPKITFLLKRSGHWYVPEADDFIALLATLNIALAAGIAGVNNPSSIQQKPNPIVDLIKREGRIAFMQLASVVDLFYHGRKLLFQSPWNSQLHGNPTTTTTTNNNNTRNNNNKYIKK